MCTPVYECIYLSKFKNENFVLVRNINYTPMVPLLVERSDTKSNVKMDRFRSQLQASYVSSHTEELWYNETVCL